MIKPNWDVFKTKFSENPQKNFEWFCYLLFCKEFKKPKGIFRYKNQAALETNPIKFKEDIIGWQAKFYDLPLSNHKKEIIKTLEDTKKLYPNTTKLFFYTNQDWGQTKGKIPQGKKDIENKAKELGIKLVWRTSSFFDSEFVIISNEVISKYFFSQDNTVYDEIEEKKLHTENILKWIQSYITFKDQIIEIDRNNIYEEIYINSNQVLILSGVAGVGKTAIIKKFFEHLKKDLPFYIFKATEFELVNINDLFKKSSIQYFIEAHKEENKKFIIIDSAEKLLDLKNTDPIKEFITIIIQNNWKLIFTTRNNFIGDLIYQFLEIYKIVPLNIDVKNLELNELNSFSVDFQFPIPKDEKLLELIKNPFYLKEYLKFYKEDEEINFKEFKEAIWKNVITKSKSEIEQCFFKIVFDKVNKNQFFINPDCEPEILNEFKSNEILEYESSHGFFITHDIYEEWALGKIIDNEFIKKSDNKSFFENIGISLPMRRAFRNWVSEKLLLDDNEIKAFIEKSLDNNQIESFWKDEILVSILLSDYSDQFFIIFKDELLENHCRILKRLSFLLRIACKEIDEDFFLQLGIKNISLYSVNYLLTKPKGQGWKSSIKFVFNNIDKIGIQNIYFILPILYDWNSKFKKGETTRLSGLIAIKFYEWTFEYKKNRYQRIKEITNAMKENPLNYQKEGDIAIVNYSIEHLLQIILFGSSEIKEELKTIFENIIKYNWKKHRDPYYELSEFILTKLEGRKEVSKILPQSILQLANLFWYHTPKNEKSNYRSSLGIEQYFGIEGNEFSYYPPSSYQTPFYWLLKTSQKETIDFILEFTNKTIECFAKSKIGKKEIQEIDVFIDINNSIKQYSCDRIWCIYRGTQISSNILESIYMALEKFFLERGENTDPKLLENWLLYLLKNSKSASISAIVTSIVLAYPEKTFNIAKILFQTKEFFFYENDRFTFENMAMCPIGRGPHAELFQKERIDSRDLKHRKLTLDALFLNYQYFKSNETSEKEGERRQKELWEILDNYYKKLPLKSKETETDKVWRLFLSRMDRRRMNPTIKEVKDGVIIQFNPELNTDLKEYRENIQKQINEKTKYSPLKLWAFYKIKNDSKYKEYKQFEENPKLAFYEMKNLISELKTIQKPNHFQFHPSEEENFYLSNYSITADVCSVLIRNYYDILSVDEREFCEEIILEFSKKPLYRNYLYQVSDGTESAISVLPILFQKSTKDIKQLILLLIISNYFQYCSEFVSNYYLFNLGKRYNFLEEIFTELNVYSQKDAQSLLFGYLFLKPAYREIARRDTKYEPIGIFLRKYNSELLKIQNNQLSLNELGKIDQLDLYILRTTFELIPLGSGIKEYKEIAKKIILAFAKELILHNKEDIVDYNIQNNFTKKLTYLILKLEKNEIQEYLKPFLDEFNGSKFFTELFKDFIYTEMYLKSYENFWEVWNLFKEKVIIFCQDKNNNWHSNDIIKSYLFANNYWGENVTEWCTLKSANKRFFQKISEKLSHKSITLYAISQLLYGIGSHYLNDGILWISDILDNNKNLLNDKLETDTIFYLEKVVKKYIYKNRERIKKEKSLKQGILVILNFLVEKCSPEGYMLRENIL
ncbi:MAG: ATP-binding protein [Leptospiraceae bacterium]|nr:ATP-binding protein [Leptospiraceae bacterium]